MVSLHGLHTRSNSTYPLQGLTLPSYLGQVFKIVGQEE
jgi:hypothetical protein